MPVKPMSFKMCKICKKTLPRSEFSKGNKGTIWVSNVCKPCMKQWARDYRAAHPGLANKIARESNHRRGRYIPINESKNSPAYLGVYIAENLISKYFEDVQKMPVNNHGYDFICKNGFKIDVKSSCLGKHINKRNEKEYEPSYYWSFGINYNDIADYFVLIGFDNRMNLEPQHIWIFPKEACSKFCNLTITNKPEHLAKWSQYEKPIDKLQNVCNLMKEKGVV